ncbi:MAG: nucleotidyltransferase family protein [Terriglobales bacterium]
MAYALSDHDKAEVAHVCERYGVSELLIFGSSVRGDFKPASSDIDLLVAFQPGERVGWFRFSELQEALESVFRREVHLVPKNGLRPVFRENVLAEAVPLFHDPR